MLQTCFPMAQTSVPTAPDTNAAGKTDPTGLLGPQQPGWPCGASIQSLNVCVV